MNTNNTSIKKHFFKNDRDVGLVKKCEKVWVQELKDVTKVKKLENTQ